MYNVYEPYPYCVNTPMFNPYNIYNIYRTYPCPYYINTPMFTHTDADEVEYDSRFDFAFIIPAGKWHNLINIGDTPLKLYSIYAPPQHPRGTVHVTKADAQTAEEHRGDYCQKGQRTPRQTKEFTLSELAQYDGAMGKLAYVAVNGIVYDVSDISKWSGAEHFGLTAGKDLSSQFESCHGVSSKLAKLSKVGILKA